MSSDEHVVRYAEALVRLEEAKIQLAQLCDSIRLPSQGPEGDETP